MPRSALRRAVGGVPPEEVLRRVRIPFVQRADLACAGEERSVFLVDLALSGAFVETDRALEAGAQARIRFALPGNEIPISAACRVAWRHRPGDEPKAFPEGLGLEFTQLRDDDRARLRAHIVEHCRRASRTRRFARPWPGE